MKLFVTQKKVYLFYILVFLTLSCSDDNEPPQVSIDDDDEVVEDTDPRSETEAPLAQVFIDTKGIAIVDEPRISSDAILVIDNDTIYNGNMGIEFRGASSQGFPKKSYRLETWDENNEDINVSLFGLPEEEDWILHGPYSDKALMRNILVYDLSRDIGRYASRTLFVDVTINNQYQGVYVFMESLKRDGDRIDINKLKEDENTGEDLTGGYILKIDKLAGSNLGEGYNDLNSFVSSYEPPNASNNQDIFFLYEEPDAEDITVAQKEYISNYISDFEDALSSEDFTDLDTGYPAYIDVDSFIDFFILNELANNVDGYRLSTYMHKDKNEKLRMGPIWDFNLAFGNADYCDGGSTNVWAYKFNDRCSNDFWLVPFWWERLMQDPTYVAQLQDRWLSLRSNELSNNAILNRIAGYESLLEESGSSAENFEVWPVLGIYIWPNNFIGQNYDQELGYFTNWIESRLSWLDAEISAL